MFMKSLQIIPRNTSPVYNKLSKLMLHYLFQSSTLPLTILNIHGACMLHHLQFLQNEQQKLFRNKTAMGSRTINNTVISRDLSVNVRVYIFDLCCRRFHQWCESNSELEQISVANSPIGSQNCFAEFATIRYDLEVAVNSTALNIQIINV